MAAFVARALRPAVMNPRRENMGWRGLGRGIRRQFAIAMAPVVTRPRWLTMISAMPTICMQMPAAAHREVKQRGNERQDCDVGMHGEGIPSQ